MTQAHLAELLGWSVSTLGDLEAGKRGVSVNDLPPLCRALELDLLELTRKADAEDLEALGIRR